VRSYSVPHAVHERVYATTIIVFSLSTIPAATRRRSRYGSLLNVIGEQKNNRWLDAWGADESLPNITLTRAHACMPKAGSRVQNQRARIHGGGLVAQRKSPCTTNGLRTAHDGHHENTTRRKSLLGG
jgi:hypothetical protein